MREAMVGGGGGGMSAEVSSTPVVAGISDPALKAVAGDWGGSETSRWSATGTDALRYATGVEFADHPGSFREIATASSRRWEYLGARSDAGTADLPVQLLEEPLRSRPGCTDDWRLGRGVKSGTSDNGTEPVRPLGVGGAPLPARCFLTNAWTLRDKSPLANDEFDVS